LTDVILMQKVEDIVPFKIRIDEKDRLKH
jgi:hypothetical protein